MGALTKYTRTDCRVSFPVVLVAYIPPYILETPVFNTLSPPTCNHALSSQLKILTTAVFSVVLMGRHFHPRKWRALLLLVLGVALVSNGSVVASDDDPKEVNFQYFLGVAAVITEVRSVLLLYLSSVSKTQ